MEAVDGTNSSGDRIGRGTLAGFDIENMDVQAGYPWRMRYCHGSCSDPFQNLDSFGVIYIM